MNTGMKKNMKRSMVKRSMVIIKMKMKMKAPLLFDFVLSARRPKWRAAIPCLASTGSRCGSSTPATSTTSSKEMRSVRYLRATIQTRGLN